MIASAAAEGQAEIGGELLCVARLIAGAPVPATRVNWSSVLDTALRERCAPLAWLRSGPGIRAHAAPAVAARWREHALRAESLARLQATELVELVRLLGATDVDTIVLKGLPLAVRLYGDVAARPVSDIDLFVPAGRRAAAHAALQAAGWRHLMGDAPEEATYEHAAPRACPILEVHSSVIDEKMLRHIAVPAPEARPVALPDGDVLAQIGPLLPVFLAAHLGKHSRGPLLWWQDFNVVWSGLGQPERDAARALARRCGLSRVLEWAVAGGVLLQRAQSPGDAQALDALRALRRLHAPRNAYRLAALADSPLARLQVLAAWVWPRQLRAHPVAYARHALGRIARRLGRLPATASSYTAADRVASDAGDQLLGVGRLELIDFVRETVLAGGQLWVRAKGGSMMPAIPRGSEVLLGPLPRRPLRRGEIVMAVLPNGQPVVHRVERVSDDRVHLKGDNLSLRDSPVHPSAAIALATHVRIAGEVEELARRPRHSLRLALGRLRWALRRRLTHA